MPNPLTQQVMRNLRHYHQEPILCENESLLHRQNDNCCKALKFPARAGDFELKARYCDSHFAFAATQIYNRPDLPPRVNHADHRSPDFAVGVFAVRSIS